MKPQNLFSGLEAARQNRLKGERVVQKANRAGPAFFVGWSSAPTLRGWRALNLPANTAAGFHRPPTHARARRLRHLSFNSRARSLEYLSMQ